MENLFEISKRAEVEKCRLADLVTELGFSTRSLSLRRTKNEADLSLQNTCHAWIVVLQMNGRKAKLGQYPGLFLDSAVER